MTMTDLSKMLMVEQIVSQPKTKVICFFLFTNFKFLNGLVHDDVTKAERGVWLKSKGDISRVLCL